MRQSVHANAEGLIMKVEVCGVYDTLTKQWLPDTVIYEEKISGGWSISIVQNGIQRVEVRGFDKGAQIVTALMKFEEECYHG